MHPDTAMCAVTYGRARLNDTPYVREMFGPEQEVETRDDHIDVASVAIQEVACMKTHISRTLLATAALAVTLTGCSTASKSTAAPPTPAPIAAAPAPAPEPPPPPPPAPAPAPVYVIEDVNFDFDKSTLKPAAIETLDQVVAGLRRQPDVNYEIAGFTDSTGSEAYNQGLSERRAVAVRDYLVANGVAPAQLTVRGYGESNPVATNNTRAGRAQNRRVEIRPRK